MEDEEVAKFAKEFDISLEEYHSQKELLDNARKESIDSSTEDKLKATDYSEEREASNSETSQNKPKCYPPQLRKAIKQMKSKIEATNHEYEHERFVKSNEDGMEDDDEDFLDVSGYDFSGAHSTQTPSQCKEQFTVGSLVSVPIERHGRSLYGVVQWIGTLPDLPGLIAGVELVRKAKCNVHVL